MEVREGELSRNKFTGELKFLGDFPSNEIVGYVATFEMLNGFFQSLYMTKSEVLIHADKYSQAFNQVAYEKLQAGEINQKELWKYSSPWYKDFDLMAMKTALKLLLSRFGMLSVEMQQAVEYDQTAVNADGSRTYIDNNDSEIETNVTETETNVPQIETEDVVEVEAENNNGDVKARFKELVNKLGFDFGIIVREYNIDVNTTDEELKEIAKELGGNIDE